MISIIENLSNLKDGSQIKIILSNLSRDNMLNENIRPRNIYFLSSIPINCINVIIEQFSDQLYPISESTVGPQLNI